MTLKNNIFYNICIMNLPKSVINKIMLYSSHPTADIMRAVIIKQKEVMIMRSKNERCSRLSFYKTWCNIELDQVKIDRTMKHLMACRYDHLDFDF